MPIVGVPESQNAVVTDPVDLEQAAHEITVREASWRARGLTVLPLTRRDDPTGWPWPFKVPPAPGSVGVKVGRDDGDYFQVFIPPEGWPGYAASHRTVVTPAPDISNIGDWSNISEFGKFLDRFWPATSPPSRQGLHRPPKRSAAAGNTDAPAEHLTPKGAIGAPPPPRSAPCAAGRA